MTNDNYRLRFTLLVILAVYVSCCKAEFTDGPRSAKEKLETVERRISNQEIKDEVAKSVIGYVVENVAATILESVCDHNFIPCTHNFDRASCCYCAAACAALHRTSAAQHCWHERSFPGNRRQNDPWLHVGDCQN